MTRLGALVKKELLVLFGSPLAYLVLTLIVLVAGLIFFDHLRVYNQILFLFQSSTMGGFETDTIPDHVNLRDTVFNPVMDECFVATRNGGARLNGNPIRASGVDDLSQALVVMSFPPRFQPNEREVDALFQMFARAQSIRRLGSAALNMCYLAAGRCDAYWATSTSAWDVAAGCCIAQEAGAIVTALDGSEFQLTTPTPAVAATAPLSRQLIATLAGES